MAIHNIFGGTMKNLGAANAKSHGSDGIEARSNQKNPSENSGIKAPQGHQQMSLKGQSSAATTMRAQSLSTERYVVKLNEYYQQTERDLEAKVNKKDGKLKINILDSQTKALIREVTPEVLEEMAQDLQTASRNSGLFKAKI